MLDIGYRCIYEFEVPYQTDTYISIFDFLLFTICVVKIVKINFNYNLFLNLLHMNYGKIQDSCNTSKFYSMG